MGCDNNTNSKKQPVLCKFGYVDYIVLASTIAIAIAEDFDNTDLNILATFFAVLSDELALIASVQQCPSCEDDDTNQEVFVPPVPDVAVTSSRSKTNLKNNNPKKRTIIKKVKRKKIKKNQKK